MGQTFEELISRHLDDLYSAALCFTLDERRAEDLLQEASIRAFHEVRQVEDASEFRLAMLAVLVSTFLKRQRRAGHDPLAPDGELAVDIRQAREEADIAPFPEPGTPGYRILRDWIARVWPELGDGDRLVLWLADVERVRHSRVAAMTGIDEEEVRARHYRARRRLSGGAANELQGRAKGSARA
jgi:RNA polymerase sigma factor (sigma-70 family)